MAKASEGVISRLGRSRKLIIGAMIAALSPITVGCYGSFPVTHAIYQLNGDIKPGILSQVIFWVFVILPVYWIGILADAIVFNLVEFWTGADFAEKTSMNPDGTAVALKPSADGREASLTLSRDGVVLSQVRFVRVSDTVCEARDPDGKLAGMVTKTPAGGLQFSDADGRVVGALSAEQIAGMKAGKAAVPGTTF